MLSNYRTTIAGTLGAIATAMIGAGSGYVSAAGHVLLGVALFLGFAAAADAPKS